MRQKKGFTLIELLVVIAIVALLVAVLLPSLTPVRNVPVSHAILASYLTHEKCIDLPSMDQFSLLWGMFIERVRAYVVWRKGFTLIEFLVVMAILLKLLLQIISRGTFKPQRVNWAPNYWSNLIGGLTAVDMHWLFMFISNTNSVMVPVIHSAYPRIRHLIFRVCQWGCCLPAPLRFFERQGVEQCVQNSKQYYRVLKLQPDLLKVVQYPSRFSSVA